MTKKKEKACQRCGMRFTNMRKQTKLCHRCLSIATKERSSYKLAAPKTDIEDRFSGHTIINKSEYKFYIHSDPWIKKAGKLKAKSRRCNLCFRSDKDVQMNVHHKTYLRCGAEQPDDLIVICRDCHELFTQNYHYNSLMGYHEPNRKPSAEEAARFLFKNSGINN